MDLLLLAIAGIVLAAQLWIVLRRAKSGTDTDTSAGTNPLCAADRNALDRLCGSVRRHDRPFNQGNHPMRYGLATSGFFAVYPESFEMSRFRIKAARI